MPATLPVTGDADADRLLATDPLALLIGMLLDQQVKMEVAFRAPFVLRQRLGGTLDAASIAAMDTAELEGVFAAKPALHRFPAAMARRTQELCRQVADGYGNDAGQIWKGVRSAEVLFARLRALPGFGDEKAKIFLALLAKRFGRAPAGWETVSAPFSDSTPRSVADVDSPGTLEKVRDFKKLMKAQGKGKAG
ncbi:MAG: Fe-S cluster assembly protein HesB [Acidimicrobiales bacterium]|nr:Fe-S cluster assembly protein HesB [Acidimicrobiales bacterium]